MQRFSVCPKVMCQKMYAENRHDTQKKEEENERLESPPSTSAALKCQNHLKTRACPTSISGSTGGEVQLLLFDVPKSCNPTNILMKIDNVAVGFF